MNLETMDSTIQCLMQLPVPEGLLHDSNRARLKLVRCLSVPIIGFNLVALETRSGPFLLTEVLISVLQQVLVRMFR